MKGERIKEVVVVKVVGIFVEKVEWNSQFRSDRSNRKKCSTSKGGPVFWKLFHLDWADPFSFRPKFPEILVEWIAFISVTFRGQVAKQTTVK